MNTTEHAKVITQELAATVEKVSIKDGEKLVNMILDAKKVMKTYSKSAEIFVAGGISLETIPAYAALNPDVLIVGGGISNAADPVQEAKLIYESISP